MKTEKKRWRPSPVGIVLATACIVIAGTTLVGWLNARRYRVNARVEIAEPIAAAETSPSPTLAAYTGLPDGEVARMAERIREATGLLMGLTVLAVTEQMGNRNPAGADALVNLMARHRLLPPGVSQTSTGGALTSDRATIYVRYRPQPLGIEVISIGRKRLDGPAVIARLVAGGDDNTGAVLLVAKKAEGIAFPEAFTPFAEVATLNWSIEPLRERAFAEREMDQLKEWTQQHATTSK